MALPIGHSDQQAELIRRLVIATRQAQGLPPRIVLDSVIAKLAVLVATADEKS